MRLRLLWVEMGAEEYPVRNSIQAKKGIASAPNDAEAIPLSHLPVRHTFGNFDILFETHSLIVWQCEIHEAVEDISLGKWGGVGHVIGVETIVAQLVVHDLE